MTAVSPRCVLVTGVSGNVGKFKYGSIEVLESLAGRG